MTERPERTNGADRPDQRGLAGPKPQTPSAVQAPRGASSGQPKQSESAPRTPRAPRASAATPKRPPRPTEPLEPTEISLGAVLSALADPHRRRVIHALVNDTAGSERSCTSFGLELSKSTRSHHFKVLREAGLVHQVDRGNRSGVTLRRRDLDARFPGLLALIGSEAEAG